MHTYIHAYIHTYVRTYVHTYMCMYAWMQDISSYARFVLDPPLNLVLLMGGINFDKATNQLKVCVCFRAVSVHQ